MSSSILSVKQAKELANNQIQQNKSRPQQQQQQQQQRHTDLQNKSEKELYEILYQLQEEVGSEKTNKMILIEKIKKLENKKLNS